MTARLVPILALLATAAAAAIAWFVLDGAAHVEDEATYRWQAALLAGGHLGGPPPELQAWVPLTFCRDGSCYGAFPSGWPAVLAAGMAAGVPWLVNPFLHGLLTWRAAALAGRLAGPSTALLAALLVGFSPQMLLLGASGMSHTWVALLGVVGAELAVAWRARPRPRLALAMGLVAGLCFLARPLCGVLLTGFLAVACPTAWLALLPLGAAVALQGAVNVVTTGSATDWPIDAWVRIATDLPATCNRMGFGPERGCIPGRPPGHDLAGAVANTTHNLRAWSTLLLGDPALLLLPILGALTDRWSRRWLALAVAIVLAYGLYWFDGTAYGARFYHLAAPLLLVAAAIALVQLPRVVTLVTFVALAARLAATLPELDGYWGVDGRAARLARAWDQGPAVVLVDTRALGMLSVDLPRTGPRGGAFQMPPRHAWATANDVGDVLFADLDQLPAARALGRPLWVWEMRPDPADDRLLRLTGVSGAATP